MVESRRGAKALRPNQVYIRGRNLICRVALENHDLYRYLGNMGMIRGSVYLGLNG